MKLDPTTYHRWRFAAALAFNLEVTTNEFGTQIHHGPSRAWSDADAFLAAGGYECSAKGPCGVGDGSALQEPADEDWREAVGDWKKDRTAPIDAISPEGLVWISRRAHELARMRSQK